MTDILKELEINSFTEGNKLEAKKAESSVPKTVWDTYCSFSNTEGGVILLGVSEDENHTLEVTGVNNPEKIVKEFWDCINNKEVVSVNLLGNSCVKVCNLDGKSIIKITVPRAERIYRPVFKGKDMFSGTYRRNGEGDYKCTREEVSAMFRDAGETTADTKIVTQIKLTDLSKETVRQYRQRFVLVHADHSWNSLSDEDFLRKIGAAKLNQEDGKVYPTAAGLLMFGNESEILYEFPQYFLDYQEHFDSSVRWSDRFVSSSGEWSGNLFDFFFKTSVKLTEDVKRPFVLDGITRVDDTAVHKAIREILLNTIANTDYYGRCGVVVKKYKDKFVFENPGIFRISINEALNGGISDPRNTTIMKMFSLIDIGERAGSGIPDVVAVWKSNFGFEPEYEQKTNPDRTITTLYLGTKDVSAVTTDEIAEETKKTAEETKKVAEENIDTTEETAEERVLKLIKECPNITATEISSKLGFSEDAVFRYTKKLKDKKKISRVGATKNGYWEIIK